MADLGAREKVFDEHRLRQDIVATWGEHGAHIDVFDHMLKQINVLKSKLGGITADNGSKQLRRDVAHKEAVIEKHQMELHRLRDGLRRLKNQDYDSGYTAEEYADAMLSGHEPSGEATIHD